MMTVRMPAITPACRALIVWTAVWLVACVGYTPARLPPEALAAEFDARNLDDPALAQFLAANGRSAPAGNPASWDFEALTLAAFYFNPGLDIARADWAVARAGIATAAERPNPTLSLSPGYDTSARGVSPWILGYILDVPIETFGKRRHRMTRATHLAEAVRLNLAATAWAVRSGVRRALIELQAAREAAALWREQEPLLAEYGPLLAAQFDAGALTPAETIQAQAALDLARLAQRDAEQLAVRGLSRLAEAIGLPLAALGTVDISFRGLDQAPMAPSLADARKQALTNRADLLAALAEFAAADETLRLELARQYPDFHLAPGYSFDQGQDKWEPIISLTLPIFSQNRGPIAEAKAARDAAAARFIDLQARVLTEVDQAAAAYTAARASLPPLESLRLNIDRQVRIVRAQQTAGELSKVEMTTALLDAHRNTLNLLEARTRTEVALSALEDATQRPLPTPLWSDAPARFSHATAPTHE
jgi:cobalt-zinc-cadmium efflux system outer membrane protein